MLISRKELIHNWNLIQWTNANLNILMTIGKVIVNIARNEALDEIVHQEAGKRMFLLRE